VPLDQEQLDAFRTKVNSFLDVTKNWSKKLQKTAHWQQGSHIEMLLQGGYLINFKNNVKVVYMKKPKNGGNGEIQKCFIEDDPAIPRHWKFATKRQKGDTVVMLKVWFNAKAMTKFIEIDITQIFSKQLWPQKWFIFYLCRLSTCLQNFISIEQV
jgi:hypothetical protein